MNEQTQQDIIIKIRDISTRFVDEYIHQQLSLDIYERRPLLQTDFNYNKTLNEFKNLLKTSKINIDICSQNFGLEKYEILGKGVTGNLPIYSNIVYNNKSYDLSMKVFFYSNDDMFANEHSKHPNYVEINILMMLNKYNQITHHVPMYFNHMDCSVSFLKLNILCHIYHLLL